MKILLTGLLIFSVISVFAQDTHKKFVEKSFYDGTSVFVPENVSLDDITELAATVRPSARQLRWQKYGMLGFIHFNLNSFYGREWGTGTEDLSIFNPEQLDASQWVTALKSAGIKSIILVCKHHDGLCLWPSKYRERTIARTPYKSGMGDIVREFTDACRKEGIETCFYYSPWDKQNFYGEKEYNDLMINELTELLTNYGLVDLVWFDGAGIDPKISGVKMDFDWPRIYTTIRSLQPQALISGAGPDIRWVGNEGGRGRFTEWSVQGIQLSEAEFSGFDSGVNLVDDSLGYRNQLLGAKQLAWYPARGGLPVRHGWFWNPSQSSRTLSYLINSYFETVGQNSNLLVNLSPDTCGLIPAEDVKLMENFGDYLNTMYERNFASGAVAQSTSVRDGGYAANYLFDEDIRTCWVAPEGNSTGEINVELYDEQKFNIIELREAITEFGQRIEKFSVEVWTGSEWEIAGEATTIGFRRLLRIPDTKTNKIKITIQESRKSPSIATLKLYYAPKIEASPVIRQNAQGKVILEGNGMPVNYTTDGSSPLGNSAKTYTEPFSLPLGGKVRAVIVSSNPGYWHMESSQIFGIESKGWILTGGQNNRFAADNNPATVTEFNLSKPSNCELIIDLPHETKLSALGYLPPQGSPNEPGRIESYSILTRTKNGKWEELISGNFSNIDNNPIEQMVKFEEPIISKSVKFIIKKATREQTVAKVAEIKLY